MNNDTTDISSDFDRTAQENETFDRNELLVWASKLELESIDYRTTSIELMEKLSRISNQLSESLKKVDRHIFEIKNRAAEKDIKLKNFIELSISDELDQVYKRITSLSNKIKKNQNQEYQYQAAIFKATESRFEKFVTSQKSRNAVFEDKLAKLQSLISTGGALKIVERSSVDYLPQLEDPSVKKTSVRHRKYKRSNRKIVKLDRNVNNRGPTITRKLIFDC